jgi:hypothetical protein
MAIFLSILVGLAVGYWFRAFRERNEKHTTDWQKGFQIGYNAAWDDFDDDSQFYAQQSRGLGSVSPDKQ